MMLLIISYYDMMPWSTHTPMSQRSQVGMLESEVKALAAALRPPHSFTGVFSYSWLIQYLLRLELGEGMLGGC